MSHYKLNPPPYSPHTPTFIGVPDSRYGAILTDELLQADGVIRAFGAQGPNQQAYVEDFFNGTADSPPASATLQLTDIDEHFSLTPAQEQAINRGCANVRVEFQTGLKIANALGQDGGPAPAALRVGAGDSAYVSVAKVGSQYQARCDAFQKGLNAGGHGPK
jgi:hypothetical protein